MGPFHAVDTSSLRKAVTVIPSPKSFLAVGVLVLLGAVPGAAAGPGQVKPVQQTPNYFPLQVGNAWHYQLTANANKAKVVNRIGRTETVNGVALAVLETSVPDKGVVNTEHLLQNDKGIFRYRNNTQDLNPPLLLMKFPFKAGEKWEGDITINNEKGKYYSEAQAETITVPAGQFKTVRVVIRAEAGAQKFTTTYWFAQNIGLVKQTAELPGLNLTMELEKFERAK
jgi:hypothetical protein